MPPSSLALSSKRRKISQDSGNNDIVGRLESTITDAIATNASLNPLTDLLHLASTSPDAGIVHRCIYALYRLFVSLIDKGALQPQNEEGSKVVRQWILERLDEFSSLLHSLLRDEESSLRTSALSILFSLLKHLSKSLSKSSTRPQFHVSFFKKIIHALLLSPPSLRGELKPPTFFTGGAMHADIRDLFLGKYLNIYDDIRWFFMRDAQPILAELAPEKFPNARENVLSVLERLTSFPTTQSDIDTWWIEELGFKPPKLAQGQNDSDEQPSSDEDEDDWTKFFDDEDKHKDSKPAPASARLHQLTVHQSLHSLSSHRAVFTRLWLTLLPQLSSRTSDGNSTLSMRALNFMHRGVMPHLTRAVMVMDWVSSCVDYGGAIGLLALNALFVLMQEYNLDYPSFYTRLYAFLDEDLLHLKHRARFFRLTDLFLSSSHLPATLLASFVKRLSRLSLNAPPSSIIIMIPFAYNILKRHPALMVMIHRDGDMAGDTFLPDEPNPNLTQALDSSLWELYSHRQHYHAGVSTLARIFEEAFTKPAYPLEDFLDHTYATLFDVEVKRRIKKEPATGLDLPKYTFPTLANTIEEVEMDVLGKIWVF
ncbi:CBF-domain-containing protein [Dentipellis sp. KUC8613]|nr:CBF-domain-containing protein [Dentipellis sp. KUC8613]